MRNIEAVAGTLQPCPGYVAAGELGIAWLRIMVAHWFRVFRARDTRARRWQVVQWTDNGQPVAAGGALYRQFHRQFFGCSRPSTEEQVRSVGGRRTEPLASSSPPLLPRPSSSAFRFPGCGVIRRCYSWLTGCWNLSTAAALVVQSLGNAVPR